MKIAIRVDASIHLGSGHVMRCLTLANQLRGYGGAVVFVCRELNGHLCELIESRGYRACRLPAGVAGMDAEIEQTRTALMETAGALDWLVVDHYSLDWRWESHLRACAKHITVIDDLADRRHDCDVLLDQNYYTNMESRYDGLLPPACQKFLGPRYALLRTEFDEVRKTLAPRDGTIKSLLVFFGSVDPSNETTKVLTALRMLQRNDIAADVVVGLQNPHKHEIERVCRTMRGVRIHREVKNMAALMATTDLCVGAGGATTWERCFLGLPTITVVVADNQLQTTLDIAKTGAIWYLGRGTDLLPQHYAEQISQVIADPEDVKRKSVASMQLIGSDRAGGERPLLEAMVTKGDG